MAGEDVRSLNYSERAPNQLSQSELIPRGGTDTVKEEAKVRAS